METLNEKGVQIIKKNVTIKKNDKNWVLNANMQLEESAAELVPTSTEPIGVEEETVQEETAE